jgi:murein DD-endopeptidase MepM/ murein hydrolase activator NlpD
MQYIVVTAKGADQQHVLDLFAANSAIILNDYTDLFPDHWHVSVDDTAAIEADADVLSVVRDDTRITLAARQSMVGALNAAFFGVSPSLTMHFTRGNWGLARISAETNALTASQYGQVDLSYSYTRDGTGVDIYVIDGETMYPSSLGANTTEGGPASRITVIFDDAASISGINYGDESPQVLHADTCAGFAAGYVQGPAKGAKLYYSRAFHNNSASVNSVLAAMAACLAHHNRKKELGVNRPSLVNMSFGALSDMSWYMSALDALTQAGMVMFIAAGNEGANLDIVDYAPAEYEPAITVGACQINDSIWPSSNYGSIIDVFAPGNALGTFYGLESSMGGVSSSGSGTSYATPFVLGVSALYLQGKDIGRGPEQQQEVRDFIVNNAFIDKLTLGSAAATSPNRLLNSFYTAPTNAKITWVGPDIDSSAVNDLTVITSLASPLQATSSDGRPVRFTLVGGRLPWGYSINETTGSFVGNPNTFWGSWSGSFTVRAWVQTDSGEPVIEQYRVIRYDNIAGTRGGSITGNTALFRWHVPTTMPSIMFGIPSRQRFLTQDNSGGERFATFVSGTIPPGMSYNNSTGVLSGTPTSSGMYQFTLGVVYTTGSPQDTRTYTLQVLGYPSITASQTISAFQSVGAVNELTMATGQSTMAAYTQAANAVRMITSLATGQSMVGAFTQSANAVKSIKWALPTTRGKVTDVPGSHRLGGRTHTGYDIAVDSGTFVYAAGNGVVTHAVTKIDRNPAGRRVYIKHEDGSTTRYLHLSKVDTFAGVEVKAGDYLGLSGSSGPFDDGDYAPHLHFERRDAITDELLPAFGDSRWADKFKVGFTWDIGLNDDEAEAIAQAKADAQTNDEY